MADGNIADGIFKVQLPEQSMEFTGERMTTAIEGEIEFEHFHRYCLARDLCPGLDVLDVASGEGYGSSILANVARSVTGVDVDPAAIVHAQATYAGENLRFLEGSVLDLPLGDVSVDAVVSFETLEHVREHARFMAQVKRVLRPGGKLIVSTPERAIYSARGEPVNTYHLLELTVAEFDSLLRANFRHVLILSQRSILGSLIVAAESGGAWRSYERRSLEHIEASDGLTRAPFLVAIASDEAILNVPSSVYLDRRRPAEVIGGYLQLRVLEPQAQAAQRELDEVRRVAQRELEEVRSALTEAVRSIKHDALKVERQRDQLQKSLTETRQRSDESEVRFRSRGEDHIRTLAGLRRADYDGRLPGELSGLRSFRRSRRKKAKELANTYRIVAGSPLFDAEWYRASNPDVGGRKLDPALHYILYGAKEGRAPGPEFDGAEYQRANPDVLSQGVNPLAHYVTEGRKEERTVRRRRDANAAVPDGEVSAVHVEEDSACPLVSVIVPNYNHKEFLTDRLDSILNQTYKNLEIILLDDNSTDESQDLLRSFQRQNPKIIKLILNDTNSGGVFSQWKNGIDHARGELVWICESDDFCENDFLEHIVPHFDDLSVNLAFGRVQYASSDGQAYEGLDDYREAAEGGIWGESLSRPAHGWFSRGFGVSNVIPNVGGAVWRNHKLPDPVWDEARTAKIAGDWFLYCHAAGGGRIAYEPRAISYFRQHGRNTSVSRGDSYYSEHMWLVLALKRIWGIPNDAVDRFHQNLLQQYRHFNREGSPQAFKQLFDVGLVHQAKRVKPHILIAMLGFHLGGGEVFPIQLANSLKRAGHFVSVFALDMTHVNKGMLSSLDSGIAVYSANYVADVGIDRFLSEAGVSIIHSHMISVDMFFFNQMRMKAKCPYIVTLHGSYETAGLEQEELHRILEGVSFWVYLTEKNLRTLRTGLLDERRVAKFGNALPLDPRPFPMTREDLGIPGEAVVFTLASRGIKSKGWEPAIKAFTRLRSHNPQRAMHLLLCGEGEEAERLRIVYQNVPQVTFLGYQSHISGLFRMSDCAILPTRFAGESFPLSLVQAMQTGTPIIATRAGEIESMLYRGEKRAGILIDAEEIDELFVLELIAAMREMLDDGKRRNYSLAAAEFGAGYDMNELIDKYMNLYEYVMREHRDVRQSEGEKG